MTEGYCTVAVYSSPGVLYATKSAGPHDWRLHERQEVIASEFTPQGEEGYDRAYGTVALVPAGHREVWYCARCRLIEERLGP